MTGRQFQVDWRPDATAEALRAAYRAEQDIMLRARLHALWLLSCGRLAGRLLAEARLQGGDVRRKADSRRPVFPFPSPCLSSAAD